MKMNKIELDEYLTQFNETYHVIATFIAHCFSLEFTDQAVTFYVLFTPLRTSIHICSSLLFAKLSENPE